MEKSVKNICIVLTMLIACIATGCKPNGNTTPPEIFDGNRLDLFKVKIDSATACCGIDSFTIKSPWLQQCIHSYLADSTTLKQSIMVPYYIVKLQDESTGDDYIWIVTYQEKFTLYNCAGDTIQHCDANDTSYDDYLKEAEKICQNYAIICQLVLIEIGMELYDWYRIYSCSRSKSPTLFTQKRVQMNYRIFIIAFCLLLNLQISQDQVNIDIAGLPNGWYQLLLVQDGEIIETDNVLLNK